MPPGARCPPEQDAPQSRYGFFEKVVETLYRKKCENAGSRSGLYRLRIGDGGVAIGPSWMPSLCILASRTARKYGRHANGHASMIAANAAPVSATARTG